MSVLESVGSVVVGVLAGGGLVALVVGWTLARANQYWDSYLEQKGKQLATKEDFAHLLDQQRATTREVEGVRASITGELWLTQERWKLKRESYVALVGTLAEMHLLLLGTVESMTTGVEGPIHDVEKVRARMAQLSVDLNRALRVAALWLDLRSVGELERVEEEFSESKRAAYARVGGWQKVIQSIEVAQGRVIATARKEFGL